MVPVHSPDLVVAACKLRRHVRQQRKWRIPAVTPAQRYFYTVKHHIFVIDGENVTSHVLNIDAWNDSDGMDPGDNASYSGAMVRIVETPVL